MEVTDEAVDMADIDELSLAILEPVPSALSGVALSVAAAEAEDAVTAELAAANEVGDVTITINSRGEINVDQSALAEVLGSGQQTARVTFVRVDDGGLSTIENQVDLDASELLAAVGQADVGVQDAVDPHAILLDLEQMNKLEKVLESDEARNFLGDAIAVSEGVNPAAVSAPAPSRRSQRQVDRETRQTADKIRAENQEIMKNEASSNPKTTPGSDKRTGPPGGRKRPARKKKVPGRFKEDGEKNKDQEDNEGAEEEDGDDQEGDDDDDSDTGSWQSEDDPDRLWCICQQPHSNKFMICCDSCLDWFHGKCMGITKAQGNELEAAGKEWRCPKCTEEKSKPAGEKSPVDDLLDESLLDDEIFRHRDKEQSKTNLADKSLKRRKSSANDTEEAPKKRSGPSCHVCPNPARSDSIYCGEACISSHATQALSVLTKDGKTYKASNPVVVLEPKTNTLFTGPNAPTESSLESWLKIHRSFHVVMPGKKTIGKSSNPTPSKDRPGIKLISPRKMQTPDKRNKETRIDDLIKKRPVKSKEEMVAEAKAALRRSVSSQEWDRPSKRERRNSGSTDRRPVPIRRKIEKPRPEPMEEVIERKSSDKSLRSMVVRGTRDALLEKLKKSDLKFEESKVLKVAEEIEIAMFGKYSKQINHKQTLNDHISGTFGDTGSKYKNKYRSLTYNLKDPKNDGLFRRIMLKDLSPIEVKLIRLIHFFLIMVYCAGGSDVRR